MTGGRRARQRGQRGSILLPVLLLLLLLATAATAMTLQARTSLREAATRRDRLRLATTADAAVRAAALAMAKAASAQASPPFSIDGTPGACRLGSGGRLEIAIQDQGGLVDLNKGLPDLVRLILTRSGLERGEITALTAAIMGRRADDTPKLPPRVAPRTPRIPEQAADHTEWTSVNELSDVPGVPPAAVERVKPFFTTSNGSAGVDPQTVSAGLRALIPARELTSAGFEAMTAPSRHSDFTITAIVTSPTGQRYGRRAAFRLDADAGSLGRFIGWDAVMPTQPASDASAGAFCSRVADALDRT